MIKKTQHYKIVEYNQNSTYREIYGYKCESRKDENLKINDLRFHLRKLENEKQLNPKRAERKK